MIGELFKSYTVQIFDIGIHLSTSLYHTLVTSNIFPTTYDQLQYYNYCYFILQDHTAGEKHEGLIIN